MPDSVLVDTSVWIEYFRKQGSPVANRLNEFLKLNRVCYVGPMAVELLQGAKTTKEVQVLNKLFDVISYIEISRDHYLHAGRISREAARKGDTFSTVDMIIAITAYDEQLSLYSFDKHFEQISKYCPLSLIIPKPGGWEAKTVIE